MGKNQDKKAAKKRVTEGTGRAKSKSLLEATKELAEQDDKVYEAFGILPDNTTQERWPYGNNWGEPAPNYWPPKKNPVHIPNREHQKEERCHYCGKHHNVGRLVTINGTKEIRKVCPDCLIKALDLLLTGDVTVEIVEE